MRKKKKENIKKVKRKPKEWVKIFIHDISDKMLRTYIYKELIQLNSKNTNKAIKNWANDLTSHFSKEDIQKVNMYMRRCSKIHY